MNTKIVKGNVMYTHYSYVNNSNIFPPLITLFCLDQTIGLIQADHAHSVLTLRRGLCFSLQSR